MGCIVLVLGVGQCAFRPPRVVFVFGLVSLINSLTSGKNPGFELGSVSLAQIHSFSARGLHRGLIEEEACTVCLAFSLPRMDLSSPVRTKRASWAEGSAQRRGGGRDVFFLECTPASLVRAESRDWN